ncbi:MAG: rhomboid family intramembrane serine protease [Bacilli bacterium]|nr:rhomboid family intramembrane serine protease [Bacilli bacterium]
MNTVVISKKDEIIMSLVHYFVTEEDYTPIVVKGVKDEIWLENSEGTYNIIRINSNHIHNDEQFKFDIFKTRSVMKQIKKKTLALNMNALNIFLDLDDSVKLDSQKNIDFVKIEKFEEIKKNEGLLEAFPKIQNKLIQKTEGLDFIINVTNDLNKKTEKENKKYEKTFKPKKIITTQILMVICIMYYLIIAISSGNIVSLDSVTLLNFGAINQLAIKNGEVIRLILAIFLHANIIHLLVNMYSLSVIGKQVETYFGKIKMIIICLVSGICGSLLSTISGTNCGVGFSGAIFGLIGSLLYFGYHYRLYLGEALKSELIPMILYNLALSLLIPNIDFFAHLGGLVGGFLCSMALGVDGKSKTNERINGIITTLIFIGFLIILIFKYI